MMKLIRSSIPWSSKIMLTTFIMALFFSFMSSLFREGAGLVISLTIVLVFILIGIIGDTIGLASATAKEEYFRAMASKKIKGAKEATYITRNAPLFSSFFNDVVGDIAGIVSGAASTSVVFQLGRMINTTEGSLGFIAISVLLTSLIAAVTVGGKAVCKTIAIYKSTPIILFTGKILYMFKVVRHVLTFQSFSLSKRKSQH
ncbi:hypothetical protein FH966_01825 [Lentibacillus cibarius]|uniref:Mg2+ and Co2+ transporter CorB n=1 Tax=Lentibacillus cibarius TaxID=2583219 RepID=A0A549YFD2_9BACI|nr:hypothetical protein [Lentibacillus cibarius]TRM10557.1 hypothetical protein FH966_01825 [Lentibacillus cibarius]